jgi:predicted hotdog family 3-hydroxylacyl-ACP dehydratase
MAGYRAMAARYREMAEAEGRPFVRDGFLQLARQFETAVTRLKSINS